jgi:hypothetical protein
VAGNIDRATPQEILVARYIMRRERRRIGAQETGRDAAFAAGETPKPRAIPSRGRSVYLRIENWPEDDDPLLAGVPLHREGSAWVLRQNLPGGIYDLVVQVARPMLGGVRAIPVGVARLTVPQDQPLMARVKGTGMLDRIDGDDPIPKGWKSDGWIDGADAARLVMIDRDVSEDRLAVALVDPSRPTALVKDRRKRRSLVVSPDPATALWAGQGTPTSPTRPPAKPRTRRVTVHFAGPMPTELILPHTDILRGSLTIEPEDGTAPFAPVRDFFANPAQGRVLMTENALSRFDAERNTPLRVQYDIDAFAPRLLDTDTLTAGGIANATTWGTTGERHHDAAASRKSERGLIERIIRWFGG